ncbi:MAG: hypothetical protein KGH69_01505 [Candidatus Micrarchaeota archaeon]|nr:hypothetical protein [Candidatus Micrarchaeota archaeon]
MAGKNTGQGFMEGMDWRVGLSIIVFFGTVAGAILWLFFYAGSYSIYQNLAAVIVMFLIFVALMGAVWASFGMKQGKWWMQNKMRHDSSFKWDEKMDKKWENKWRGCGGYGMGGAVYGLGFLGALVYYLSTATSFWMGILGVVKAVLWPGILVYIALKALGG